MSSRKSGTAIYKLHSEEERDKFSGIVTVMQNEKMGLHGHVSGGAQFGHKMNAGDIQ